MSNLARLTLATGVLMATAGPGLAQRIHTGGEQGAYHRDFCPAIARELTTISNQGYACTVSSGTRENMERVRAQPRDFGYGQLDVFMLESGQMSMGNALQIVRQDDARECVFAVTRNKDIQSYGELAAFAATQRFHLPPQASGSAGTFQFLRFLDRNGLGRSDKISYAANADEAIRAALSRDDGVALFVQFPDPDNERFKLVRDLGGHFVPVVDRSILTQSIGGREVYVAKETRIQNGRSLFGGRYVTTACMPMVLFSGNPERLRDRAEQRSHTETIAAVRALNLDVVVPRQSIFRTVAQRTRELSVEGRERFLAYSARARDRALPFWERMIERAAPRLDSADR
jgi:hypothetical protein